ncbi:dynein regulatory complex protein 11-like [Morphnus guianensis]
MYWISCSPNTGKIKAREEKYTLVHNSTSTSNTLHMKIFDQLFTFLCLFQVAAELAARKEMALQKKAQKGKKEQEGKEKTKGKKPQKTGKKEEEEGWKMAPSNFLSIMEEGNSQYKAVWQNRGEGWDFLQDHDLELIKEEKREEVEEEIRVQVDELMQQKLENLKLAVDGEKSDKQKKGRKSEKKKRTTMRKKIPEMEEDLTPDRTIDSLYRELVEEGLLIKAKTVNLSDYVGKVHILRLIWCLI